MINTAEDALLSDATDTRIFDEMSGWAGADPDALRAAYAGIREWLAQTPHDRLHLKRREAEVLFRRIGITFAVYGEGGDPERILPFDLVPRIVTADEWSTLSRGLAQRVRALNAFLTDIYHAQDILKAGVIPSDLVLRNVGYLPQMQGLHVPGNVYTHIAGIDLVRTDESDFFVLEDNVRTPSGVSYMLENRDVMMRLFPDLLSAHQVRPVDHYPSSLRDTLCSVAPPNMAGAQPTVVLLTPGIYNSAYYEHTFLADQMGVELVEGQDLFVAENKVFMRTTEGPKRVDIIYRRLDDDFLDPLVFRPDSTLGVPGLIDVYRAGNVTLANAVGAGIADDKMIYTFVPAMIRFYLGEEPMLNNVPTRWCGRRDDCQYVLEHLGELVVKEVRGSGGYGMLVGPKSTRAEQAAYAERIKANPGDFIAQPTLALSTCPTLVDEGVAPRHVDLRPFLLVGSNGVSMVPGGLTRVALREGSLVVNSSQGGGTKDTWVLNH
ncbi:MULTISPECIES: circularly permuted type 2 ATP-grasp protein [Tistrella]|uniref:circularly permuted type 2 ATP-grasp protein n=1 Tax=Tistrella TaxID=171436 RepID=UPI00355626B7